MIRIKHKASWQLSAERQGLPGAEWTPPKELFPVCSSIHVFRPLEQGLIPAFCSHLFPRCIRGGFAQLEQPEQYSSNQRMWETILIYHLRSSKNSAAAGPGAFSFSFRIYIYILIYYKNCSWGWCFQYSKMQYVHVLDWKNMHWLLYSHFKALELMKD